MVGFAVGRGVTLMSAANTVATVLKITVKVLMFEMYDVREVGGRTACVLWRNTRAGSRRGTIWHFRLL